MNTENSNPRPDLIANALKTLPEIQLTGGMKLEKWRKAVGISRTAAWRLRKTGKLPVVVRYGSVYVTADTIKTYFSNDGSKPRGFAMN
jgi:hypothetical protein